MNAEQFFHVCRSAAAIADVEEITVFGAAAVAPWIARECPETPPWPSMELDLDPGGKGKADLVDGSIGEASLFEETFGVRAHGVTLEAFVPAADWESRAVVFKEPVSGVRIRTPHPLDLAVAKLVRGEDRDWEFAAFCRRHFDLSIADPARGLQSVEETRSDYAEPAKLARSLLERRLGSA